MCDAHFLGDISPDTSHLLFPEFFRVRPHVKHMFTARISDRPCPRSIHSKGLKKRCLNSGSSPREVLHALAQQRYPRCRKAFTIIVIMEIPEIQDRDPFRSFGRQGTQWALMWLIKRLEHPMSTLPHLKMGNIRPEAMFMKNENISLVVTLLVKWSFFWFQRERNKRTAGEVPCSEPTDFSLIVFMFASFFTKNPVWIVLIFQTKAIWLWTCGELCAELDVESL